MNQNKYKKHISKIGMGKRYILILILSIAVFYGQAQSIKFNPIQFRNDGEKSKNEIKLRAIGDSLDLPFLDDFTSTNKYPDQRMWIGNQVYINNTFSNNPINYNVATLEHLNSKGNPYGGLSKNEYGYADSLTSTFINLNDRKSGSSRIKYKKIDSIILSFYYQLGGLGDAPANDDSLLLFFKNRNNNWDRVWTIGGGDFSDFKQVLIVVDSAKYFYKGFQFRFVNFTHRSGNLNHWNLDFVRLASNRKTNEKFYQEVGIVSGSRSLLKNHFELPYSHFKFDYANQFDGIPLVKVRNLNNSSVLVQFGFKTFDKANTLMDNQAVGVTTRNILANSDSLVDLKPTTTWNNLASIDPFIKMQYSIFPGSNDFLAINENAPGSNNELTVLQRFKPWYAYDDGSAEGGIYLDYGNIPPTLPSQFAIKFNLLKPDSVRGIAVFFNQSNDDVRARSFRLRIWKKITASPGTDKTDQYYFNVNVSKPTYTDSINGFHFYMFDSAKLLPAGEFYVGWYQPQSFNLNIGYDNNYRFQKQDIRNPNLLQNFNGVWDKVGSTVMGAPMMRPLIGSLPDFYFNTHNFKNKYEIKLFPNPVVQNFSIETKENISKIILFSVEGKLVFESKANASYDISSLKSGAYTVAIGLASGEWTTTLLIKK